MNASLKVAVLSLSVLGLAACAGHSTKSAYVPPERAPSIMDNDDVYMAQVGRIGRRRGIGHPAPRGRERGKWFVRHFHACLLVCACFSSNE